MATRRIKRPRDPIQLGKLIVEAFADNQMLFLESLVRTRPPAGGKWIRTLGPPVCEGRRFSRLPLRHVVVRRGMTPVLTSICRSLTTDSLAEGERF